MPTWAESGVVKIKRAKKHIGDLEAEITAYRDRGGYRVVPEKQSDGRTIAKMTFTERPPVYDWGAIAGDAVHNLASALDTLVWLSISAAIAPTIPGRWAKFPFFESSDDFKAKGLGKIERASQAVADLIKATKPYPTGNDDLFGLHEFDVRDKHKVIIPAVVTSKRAEIRGPHGSIVIQLQGQPLEDGSEMLILPPKKPGENVHFTSNLTFTEPEVFRGKSVLPTLRQLSQLVNGIADQFLAAGVLS